MGSAAAYHQQALIVHLLTHRNLELIIPAVHIKHPRHLLASVSEAVLPACPETLFCAEHMLLILCCTGHMLWHMLHGLPVLQKELAALRSQHQQLTASESASRQQLAASVQAHDQASAACSSAEAELHRLSTVLEDSEAQLVLAHQKEAQVTSPHTS